MREKRLVLDGSFNDSDLKEHRDHRLAIGDDYASVVRYATTREGVDLSKMQELEGRFGFNGGRGCDVLRGPCSCGAWH